MKRFSVLFLFLATIILLLSGCQPSPQEKAQQAMENLFAGKDPKRVESFMKAYNETYYGMQAENNGDSYCVDCNKFIEGKVRICPYCGQYL